MTSKKILILSLFIGLASSVGFVACSANDSDVKPPHVVNLVNNLVGEYTAEDATINVLGTSIVLNSSSVIESKLEGDNYVFNISGIVSGAEAIQFTEYKTISVDGNNKTQTFKYLNPDSATLENIYFKFSASSVGTSYIDIKYNETTRELSFAGTVIATKN